MKTGIIYLFSICVLLFSFSCSTEESVIVPEFNESSKLAYTAQIEDSLKTRMNGIYTVEVGAGDFGKIVVCKWNGNSFSVFTGKSFTYFIFKGGKTDSTIILEGYWRQAQDIYTGLARLEINADEGGKQLVTGNGSDFQITLRGYFGDGQNTPSKDLVLKYKNPLPIQENPFWIIAHRGGGRNSDNLPESENSLEIIQLAEGFGANAIEIDVRLTKDGIPVLFHDDNLSPRLIKGEYCVGPLENYTYLHLKTFCTLKNDKPIPKLSEALETVVYKTNLSLVWLDIKTPDAIAPAIEIQKEFIQKAALAGRKVEFLIGLPSDEIISKFLSLSPGKTAPSLCELDIEDVRNTNSLIWAPAWTRGPMNKDVTSLHGEGKRVFFWTLDGPEFIRVFLKDGKADGILSNYPSIVAYEYYLR